MFEKTYFSGNINAFVAANVCYSSQQHKAQQQTAAREKLRQTLLSGAEFDKSILI